MNFLSLIPLLLLVTYVHAYIDCPGELTISGFPDTSVLNGLYYPLNQTTTPFFNNHLRYEKSENGVTTNLYYVLNEDTTGNWVLDDNLDSTSVLAKLNSDIGVTDASMFNRLWRYSPIPIAYTTPTDSPAWTSQSDVALFCTCRGIQVRSAPLASLVVGIYSVATDTPMINGHPHYISVTASSTYHFYYDSAGSRWLIDDDTDPTLALAQNLHSPFSSYWEVSQNRVWQTQNGFSVVCAACNSGVVSIGGIPAPQEDLNGVYQTTGNDGRGLPIYSKNGGTPYYFFYVPALQNGATKWTVGTSTDEASQQAYATINMFSSSWYGGENSQISAYAVCMDAAAAPPAPVESSTAVPEVSSTAEPTAVSSTAVSSTSPSSTAIAATVVSSTALHEDSTAVPSTAVPSSTAVPISSTADEGIASSSVTPKPEESSTGLFLGSASTISYSFSMMTAVIACIMGTLML